MITRDNLERIDRNPKDNFLYFSELPFLLYIYINLVMLGKHASSQTCFTCIITDLFQAARSMFGDPVVLHDITKKAGDDRT